MILVGDVILLVKNCVQRNTGMEEKFEIFHVYFFFLNNAN